MMTQSEHEEVSTSLLVRFRDVQQHRIETGETDPDDRSGNRASNINVLIWSFFDSRRSAVPLRQASSLMTMQELIDYIGSEALPAIAEYRSDLLECDWRGEWALRESTGFDLGGSGEVFGS